MSQAIGERIRGCRRYRGMTLQQLADAAGISKGYLSKIENGKVLADRRSLLQGIAEALNVAMADLTGAPLLHISRSQDAAHATVRGVRIALLEHDLGDPPASWSPSTVHLQRQRMAEIEALRARCDWTAVGARLPELLTEATAVGADDGPRRDEALRDLVTLSRMAADLGADLGYPDLELAATARAREAAHALDDPVRMALAESLTSHALLHAGAKGRAYRVASAALDKLDAHIGTHQHAAEIAGELHLTAAFMAVVLGKHDIRARIEAASELAEQTGETSLAQYSLGTSFGPTNVAMRHAGLLLEAGDPDTAVGIARQITTVNVLPRASRRAGHYVTVGRALAQLRGREREAIAAYRQAERLAPQRVHGNVHVHESVRVMLNRHHAAAGGRDLRALAARLGLVA